MSDRFTRIEAGELVISIAPHAESAVVHVDGVLDAQVAGVLTRELDALDAFPRIDVDLNGLSIVDSAGINALEDARERAIDDGRSLSLRIGTGPVRRLLEVAGAAPLLEAPTRA